MQNFLLLAFLSCYVIGNPATDYRDRKPIEYGFECNAAKNQCAKGLICSKSICVFPPSKAGEECGGNSDTPRSCSDELRCVYKDKKNKEAPGVCRPRTKEYGGVGIKGEECKDASQCNPELECVQQLLPDKTKRSICMAYAILEEACKTDAMKRTCAKGYECLSKESNTSDGVNRCYVVNVKTVAREGEPCEGKTNSVCLPGSTCKDSGSGKVCNQNPKAKDYDGELPREGQACDESKGKKTACATGLECLPHPDKRRCICMAYSVYEEPCGSDPTSRTCADGYECLQKNPQDKDAPGVCYVKGIKTVAKDHQGCEGKTNAVCAPGFKCVDDDSKTAKWCVKDEYKTPEKKVAKEGELCGGIAAFQCDKGLECEMKNKGMPDAAGKCIKPKEKNGKY